MVIIVRLKDIIVDPEKEINLENIPVDEAIELIKKSYGFLSTTIGVHIKDGIATIESTDEQLKSTDEALGFYDDGIKEANKGKYARAIKLFEKALQKLPEHVDARRNMAMSFLEIGNAEEAKNHIIDVLRLNPKDVWGLILLGNIYSKHENDKETAERFYMKAYEISPNDQFLLNNIGALYADKGQYPESIKYFEKAIEVDETYPNAYYSLALAQMNSGKDKTALNALDDMFIKSDSSDLRSKPIYTEARKLYIELNKRLAKKNKDLLEAFIEERKETLEKITGYQIQITEDNNLEMVTARTQMAYKYKRDYHSINYKVKSDLVTPHILAHEMEHIILEHEARKLNRNLLFTTTSKTHEHALNSIKQDFYKLKNKGFSEEQIENVVNQTIQGLANQLFNVPIDMFIEYRLYNEFEILRPSQFVSLYLFNQEYISIFLNKEIKRLTSHLIFKANITLNCTYALLVDYIYKGITEYHLPYKQSNIFLTSQKLFNLWNESLQSYKHGDEYTLISQFAEVLKLKNWFEFQKDDTIESKLEGVTNPELLKQKEPSSVMYLLSALQRFEKMSDDEIYKISSEIALLGSSGIDYASSDTKYSLASIPNEKFTGLQLMCLMYVGFKKVNPSLNPAPDLDNAYEIALKMFNSKI